MSLLLSIQSGIGSFFTRFIGYPAFVGYPDNLKKISNKDPAPQPSPTPLFLPPLTGSTIITLQNPWLSRVPGIGHYYYKFTVLGFSFYRERPWKLEKLPAGYQISSYQFSQLVFPLITDEEVAISFLVCLQKEDPGFLGHLSRIQKIYENLLEDIYREYLLYNLKRDLEKMKNLTQ